MSDPATRIEICATDPQIPPLAFCLCDDVPGGALLRLRASGVSMLAALEITSVVVNGTGQTLPFAHRYSRREMEHDWVWHIQSMSMAVVEAPYDLPAGTRLVVECAFREPGRARADSDYPGPVEAPARYSGLTWTLELGVVSEVRALDPTPIAPPVDLLFAPGPAERIEAYLKPDERVAAQHFDACGNPTASPGSVRVEVGGNRGHLEPAEGNAGPGAEVGGTSGVERITARDDEGREAVSNARPEAVDGCPIWFGEFHWHSEFSGDGQRSIADALRSARDELGLDFAGPADHMGATGLYSHGTVEEQAEICRRFDEPGRFCTIPGAELSARYGHANLHTDGFDLFAELTGRFEDELAPAWGVLDRYPLQELAALCPPGRAVVVPHHTNMDSFVREGVVREDGRPFWCAMHWPIPAERDVVRLVEIVQGRGAFETEETDALWRVHDGGLAGSVRTALTRGYRLGFIGGTDNHCGWPTRQGAAYCGLTATQAPRLDTATVFSALHDRRCYATSGARIVADMTLNGRPMGSELRLDPGADRTLGIHVRGTAPLTHVQVVHCGYVLADLPVEADSADLDCEWADERPGRPLQDVYYYVRIRQADGHCAWLSPVWVDVPDD